MRRVVADYKSLSQTYSMLLHAVPKDRLAELSLLASGLQLQTLAPAAEQVSGISSSQKLANLLLAEFAWSLLNQQGFCSNLKPLGLLQETPELR